jgi:ribonuclease H2 subunit A
MLSDSKTLNEADRERLFSVIKDHKDWIGYCLHVSMPQCISRFMLGKMKYNLNEQAHDTTIALIQDTLDSGIKITNVQTLVTVLLCIQ